MIGGFEQPNKGEIITNGKIFNDLPPYARPINTVFQRYALFPHLNVFENVAFGLKNRGWDYLARFFNQEEMEKEILKEKEAGRNQSQGYQHDLKRKSTRKFRKLS